MPKYLPEGRLNNAGQPAFRDHLFPWCVNTATDQDLRDAIALLCQRLKINIVKTNVTKRGDVQLEIEEADD